MHHSTTRPAPPRPSTLFRNVILSTGAQRDDTSIAVFGPDCPYMRFEGCRLLGATGCAPARARASWAQGGRDPGRNRGRGAPGDPSKTSAP
jgi:hypothetical protein